MKPSALSFTQPKFAADGETVVPRVKICGITNERDALDAIELGADALGFNTYTGSKRFVDLKNEAGWMASLPPEITKVAVMVNPTIGESEAVFALPFIDMVQFHGDENEEFCAHFARLGRPFIKAVAARDEAAIRNLARFHTRQILLDAWAPGAFGGTGKMIEDDLLRVFAADGRDKVQLILAGGLTPARVSDAIQLVRPHAVDVASGVESAPGQKDKSLMRDFIRAVAGSGFRDPSAV